MFITTVKMFKIFKAKVTYFILVIILIAHGYILTKLIFSPYPEFFVYPYLTNHGLKPYSQILDQHFPGLMFFPINLDNLGMNNADIARVWSIGIILITHLLIFFVSSQILKSKTKALLANFLYLIWQPFFEGWVFWIDSFLPLILLPSFYLLYKKKLLTLGLLLGIGVLFKQTLIPLTILTLIYIWLETKEIKKLLTYSLGLFIPIISMILYFINIGVLKDFWYWTIVFNLTTYAKFGTSIPPNIGFITRVLLVYSASIFGLFGKDRRLVKILFIFLLGSFAGIFDRSNFVHFQPSLPFALIATVLGVYQFNKNNFFKVVAVVYIVISVWWLNIFYKGHISNKVFFFDPETKQIAEKIRKYSKKGEKIFIFGAAPNLYQMSDRLPAGNIFVFQFPWFLKIAQDRILEGIKLDKPSIIVSDRSVLIEGNSITEYAKEIDQYIQKNYEVLDQLGTTSILRPK